MHGADLSKLREQKRESCCLLFIMPPLLSVPEWDGDNITSKFDVFVLVQNDGRLPPGTRSWRTSALDETVPREH
jgi:hypothetical protein